MKKLLLITLLFLSFPCFAQNLPAQEKVFEGCTVIIVQTTDKATEALNKMQTAFKNQGFTILTTDKDIFTLIANQTLAGTEMTINASVNQGGSNQIILNGYLGNGAQTASTATGSKIANTGSSESASRKAFDKMHQVALSYKGAKVLYGTD